MNSPQLRRGYVSLREAVNEGTSDDDYQRLIEEQEAWMARQEGCQTAFEQETMSDVIWMHERHQMA